MNTVIAVIREHIADQSFCFVFPSQTAANLWARKTCTLGIARSVAARRFLGWDRFKEEAVRGKETGKAPAPALARKLFAGYLIRKNAAAVRGAAFSEDGAAEKTVGFPLESVIPPEHAAGGMIFMPFIARLLPSLSYWEKLTGKARGSTGNSAGDQEDRDYAVIKREYTAFLERYGFFEPSWEEIEPRGGDARYALFFPELIEDFAEYDSLLPPPRFIRISAENAAGEDPVLLRYRSVREEIRSAAMELQKIHGEEGIPYEDMALSVPGFEEMESTLLREFSLRCIPVTLRAGKKLGETGAGRLFSLVQKCAASRFSFSSLKALLLNGRIPWREREKNKELIQFGIDYNCVSGYAQGNRIKDIWEEAFKGATGGRAAELKTYYAELKKRINGLVNAESFKDIRKHYFAFRGFPEGGGQEDAVPRGGLLDMEKITGEDNAVLSRCIEELGTLTGLEETFNDPALVPASPLAFFISCLEETEYVRSDQKPGVNIYRWRVAAASPFSCHFVLNASQGAAPVLYQPMKFLRQDKRRALGLEDRDVTGAFFRLCGTGPDGSYNPHVRISSADQTFSGWAIPHSYFAQGRTVDAPACPEDSYGAERSFWRDLGKQAEGAAAPGAIFPLQAESYQRWKNGLVRGKNRFSFFEAPVPGSSPVRELLKNAGTGPDGLLTVSPTRDLNVYFNCPLSWLYGRIFGAGEFSLEAALLDGISLGNLYHRILEKLFARIRDKDRVFDSSRLGIYKHWALEITEAAIKDEPAFKGPLAVPLVSPQAEGMAKRIAGLLDLEAELFGGYRIAELELPVSLKTGDLNIKGVIDRVSVSPNGDPVIVDYKTTYLPGQVKPEELETGPLQEFQMPVYIKLYEKKQGAENAAHEVQGAYFYSINGRKIKPAVGGKPGGKSKAPSREEYGPFLAAAEKQIEEFGSKVRALDFTPGEIRLRDCMVCMYKTVCRSAYFLNADTGTGGKGN